MTRAANYEWQMATDISFDALLDATIRLDVTWFSQYVLGVPYSRVSELIYPRPRYRYFNIEKRNGKLRIIAEPMGPLKIIQERVLNFLKKKSGPFKPYVHGFVANRSILTNAQEHCSSKTHFVLNLDLEDFFPNISFFRVRGVLKKHPYDCSHEVATVIAHICTIDGSLPQGAPTSPFLSNLVCRSLDKDLSTLARRNRARYTRYADDITFSFGARQTTGLPASICSVGDDGKVTLGAELKELITTKHHFKIHPDKTRISGRGRRMEVTGLTINRHPNVRRIYIDRIRGALTAWEHHGYKAAEESWHARLTAAKTIEYEKKPWKRQTRLRNLPLLKNIIWGKLLFLRMVRGSDDLLYNRLAERYNNAVERERLEAEFVAPLLPLEPVVRNYDGAMEAVFVLEWSADYRINSEETEWVGKEGTAFCYRQGNLLITCDHVFDAEVSFGGAKFDIDISSDKLEGLSLQLVRPGEKKSWPARVLYRNAQYDFAILEFDGTPPPHRFFAAMDAAIPARSKGILIGFPAYKNWNLPDFNDQTVLNRTEPHRGMRSFTISGAGSIRPGNSGGPFTDTQFRVAGMAQRGAYAGEGHDECLCFEMIDSLIKSWRETSVTPAAPPGAEETTPT